MEAEKTLNSSQEALDKDSIIVAGDPFGTEVGGYRSVVEWRMWKKQEPKGNRLMSEDTKVAHHLERSALAGSYRTGMDWEMFEARLVKFYDHHAIETLASFPEGPMFSRKMHRVFVFGDHRVVTHVESSDTSD
ncbi:hypothetical protein ZHAS_00009288 [Anopheles sinensis]|uniref:Uncharacterized protein n=1 Tax=Anopheles sinensis TaxID=74873 RepID=A0A084VUL3_ANOSI|nr:hypothetical protein ZHAS_00009288 [Anopheles sinensis]